MKRIITLILLATFISFTAFAQDDDSKKKEETVKVEKKEAKKSDGIGKFTFGKDKWITLHYLLQARGATGMVDATGAEYDDATKYHNWTNQFYVRRSRIILKGQVAKKVTFFAETDDFNIGLQGDGQTYARNTTATDSSGDTVTTEDKFGTFIQDAFMSYNLMKEFKIAAGLILVPFMHHNRASAVSLLGLDYNIGQVPVGSNVWRDAGVEARGIIAKKIDYKIGVFNGADTLKDRRDFYRVTGRLQINVLDAETGFFYSDNYRGAKKIISFGAGFDTQKGVYQETDTTEVKDYFAWTVDAKVDMPLGKGKAFVLNAAYTDVSHSPFVNQLDTQMYFVQTGFLLGKIQPVVKYFGNIVKSKSTDTGRSIGYDSKGYGVGLNYFINGNNANIKAEYNYTNTNPSDTGGKTTVHVVMLQGQIFI